MPDTTPLSHHDRSHYRRDTLILSLRGQSFYSSPQVNPLTAINCFAEDVRHNLILQIDCKILWPWLHVKMPGTDGGMLE